VRLKHLVRGPDSQNMSSKSTSVWWPAVLTALVLVCQCTSLADAAPGDLDPSFGTGGVVRLTGLDPQAAAVGPSGEVFIVGWRQQGTADEGVLVRLASDGSLDTSFADGGFAVLGSNGSRRGVSDVVVDGKGRPPVVGLDRAGAFALRLTASGQPDGSFGANGRAAIDSLTVPYAARLSASGQLAVVGEDSVTGAGNPSLGVVRLLADGSLDPTFGTAGTTTAPVGNASGSFGGADLAFDAEGRIVFGSLGVARLTPSGQLDPSFGQGGVDAWSGTPFPSHIRSIIPLADRIVTGYYSCEATGPGAGCTQIIRSDDESGSRISGAPTFAGVTYAVRDQGSFYAAAADSRGPAPTMGLRLLSASLEASEDFGLGGFAPVYDGLRQAGVTDVAVASDGSPVLLGQALHGLTTVARFSMEPGPADEDADGYADDLDACPAGYAAANSGCPSTARRLKMKKRRDRVIVRLKSKTPACIGGSRVKLYGGHAIEPDALIGGRTVRGTSPVSFPAGDRMRFRAVVLPSAASLTRCLGTRSRV
jgi:uncharacterized delta-60 repeat protein